LFFAVVAGEVAAKGPDDYEALLHRKSEGMVEEKAWSEGAHQLPPLPDPANLIRIDVSTQTNSLLLMVKMR
jgi:hypothetical protein